MSVKNVSSSSLICDNCGKESELYIVNYNIEPEYDDFSNWAYFLKDMEGKGWFIDKEYYSEDNDLLTLCCKDCEKEWKEENEY